MDPDGLFDHQDEPADEVAEELLRAEPHADNDRASEKRERRQRDADRMEGRERKQGHEKVLRDAQQEERGVDVLPLPAVEALLDEPQDCVPCGNADEQDQERLKQLAERDGDVADGPEFDVADVRKTLFESASQAFAETGGVLPFPDFVKKASLEPREGENRGNVVERLLFAAFDRVADGRRRLFRKRRSRGQVCEKPLTVRQAVPNDIRPPRRLAGPGVERGRFGRGGSQQRIPALPRFPDRVQKPPGLSRLVLELSDRFAETVRGRRLRHAGIGEKPGAALGAFGEADGPFVDPRDPRPQVRFVVRESGPDDGDAFAQQRPFPVESCAFEIRNGPAEPVELRRRAERLLLGLQEAKLPFGLPARGGPFRNVSETFRRLPDLLPDRIEIVRVLFEPLAELRLLVFVLADLFVQVVEFFEVFVEEGERPGRRVRERRRNRAPGFLPPLREFPDAADGPDRTGIHAPDVREKVLEFLRLFGRDAEFRRRGRRFLAPERVGAPFERFGAFPQGRFDRGEPRFGQVVGKGRRGRGAADGEREQDARKQQAEGTPPSRVAVRGAPSA